MRIRILRVSEKTWKFLSSTWSRNFSFLVFRLMLRFRCPGQVWWFCCCWRCHNSSNNNSWCFFRLFQPIRSKWFYFRSKFPKLRRFMFFGHRNFCLSIIFNFRIFFKMPNPNFSLKCSCIGSCLELTHILRWCHVVKNSMCDCPYQRFNFLVAVSSNIYLALMRLLLYLARIACIILLYA